MSKGVKREGGMLLDSQGFATLSATYGGPARGTEKPCNKIDGISLDVQSHDGVAIVAMKRRGRRGELHLATKQPLLSSLVIRD